MKVYEVKEILVFWKGVKYISDILWNFFYKCRKELESFIYTEYQDADEWRYTMHH